MGNFDVVKWQQLRATAEAIVCLASDLLGRKESEFSIHTGYAQSDFEQQVRFGYRIEIEGLNADSRLVIDQAIGPFLRGILDVSDTRTLDIFPNEVLSADLSKTISTRVKETLRKHNGKKIKAPLEITTGQSHFSVSGRFAEAQPQEIDRTPFEILGRIESLGRPERSFTVLTHGHRGHMKHVHFDVDNFLRQFREILCDDQIYLITVHNELDARGKPMLVVDNVKRAGEGEFSLTP